MKRATFILFLFTNIICTSKADVSIISSFDFDGALGLTWDGSYLWTSSALADIIYKVDPSTGSIISSIASPGTDPHGLTWDGIYLWNVDSSSKTIFQLDPTDGSIIASFQNPAIAAISDNPHGLAFDGSNLWLAGSSINTIFKLNPLNGDIIQSFDLGYSEGGAWGLAWDGVNLWNSHPRGVEFGVGFLHSIDPATGNILSTDNAPGTKANWNYGLAWDGSFLWMADSTKIYKLDVSGVNPIPVPGAALLGSIGIAFAGWRLRKRKELYEHCQNLSE